MKFKILIIFIFFYIPNICFSQTLPASVLQGELIVGQLDQGDSLKLNGTDRFSSQEQDFFSRVMTYNYTKRMPKKGILMYSFSVNPLDHQPSGSCNFSRFNSIELFLETQEVPKPTGLNDYIYKYDINVYTVNYNILRISSGMGNVEFSN